MPMMPISDRLQALLDRVREANENERNRVSLETFLADLHREDEGLDEVQLKQTQLAIYETLLRLLDSTTPVSPTTQVPAVTTSRAIQTDAATISLWDLLPKARKEAYDCGFDAGRDYGHAQSIEEGNSTGIKEGLANGCEQGQAEGLKMALEQGKEVGMQRGITMGKEVGHTNGLAKGIRHAEGDIKKFGEEDTRRHMLQREAARENIVVNLPPTLAATMPKKKSSEESKTKSNSIDPFASLLGLILDK